MKQERRSVCAGHAPAISVNAALSMPLDLDRRGAPDKSGTQAKQTGSKTSVRGSEISLGRVEFL